MNTQPVSSNVAWVGEPPQNASVWIGDFPPAPPLYPFSDFPRPSIFPVPQKLYPIGGTPWIPEVPLPLTPERNDWYDPNRYTIVTTSTPVTPWRLVMGADRITASVDVPGVKLESLNVELENGTIKVNAVRFDNQHCVSLTQFIGTDYDPSTADASLEAGVLTVVVCKFKDKVRHKVPVAAK